MHSEAEAIESAVSSALKAGLRTRDIAGGGPAISTTDMGEEIVRRLS
jgi:3-isopropylmalate dehydrogenase